MIKMWKKMSVSKKIFAGALAALLLSYVVLIIGQQFFFHKYYTYLLTQKLMSSVDGFSEEYAGWQSDDEINSGIIEYSDSGDFYIMVMGENGDLRHMVAYEMIITTETGEEIRLTLDNAIRSKQFQALELKKGDVVTVGCREPENSEHSRIYVPDRINSGGRVWMAAPVPLENNNRGAEEYKFINRTFTGEITSIALPSQQNAGIIIQRREAFAAAMDWRFRTDNFNITEEKYHYFYTNDETGNTYIVGMKRIEKNGDNEVVLAISPMRPVIEAVAVSKRMAGVWVFVGCFSAWIIAFFFTSFVSKPIMNMSAVTKKMCSLDFSERCRVTGEDEIGMLAQNINDMSEQLDITIAQLKRANEKLVEDIEH